MIVLNLVCSKEHEFESWFKSRADFDAQAKRKLVSCAVCGDTAISAGLAAPNVSPSRKKAQAKAPEGRPQKAGTQPMVAAHREKMAAMVKAFQSHVKDNFDYVGDRFAAEARKIHTGETEGRDIYGEATSKEVKDLLDDGIDVAPMPSLPDKAN